MNISLFNPDSASELTILVNGATILLITQIEPWQEHWASFSLSSLCKTHHFVWILPSSSITSLLNLCRPQHMSPLFFISRDTLYDIIARVTFQNYKSDQVIFQGESIFNRFPLPNSSGRKQRGAKEPLDEGERGELKSWLKPWRTV